MLLAQCFYYRGFTWRDETTPPSKPATAAHGEPDEQTGLLDGPPVRERRGSDWSGLSPAVPHISDAPLPQTPPSTFQTVAWNTVVVVMVCAAGVLGWFLGRRATGGRGTPEDAGAGDEELTFSAVGQLFGYLCAVAYIASRLPQLILNWRRKTTDGLSMLFFLFACLGNITYVLSILAFDARCHERACEPGETGRIYARYILVNLSWLLGSLLTLFLDLGVFAQYFFYRDEEGTEALQDGFRAADREGERGQEADWDDRPLLQRNDSAYP